MDQLSPGLRRCFGIHAKLFPRRVVKVGDFWSALSQQILQPGLAARMKPLKTATKTFRYGIKLPIPSPETPAQHFGTLNNIQHKVLWLSFFAKVLHFLGKNVLEADGGGEASVKSPETQIYVY